MKDAELWSRVASYRFPTGFKEKLCAAMNCSAQTAEKLQDEYLRFVYLAQISPTEATPSEQVDQVWHLHLSYTRDYWHKFCAEILQRDFHHDPCDGPESMPRYAQQYRATLALYEQEFGEDAPPQSWPTKAARYNTLIGVAITAFGVCLAVWPPEFAADNATSFLLCALFLIVLGGRLAIFGTGLAQSKRAPGGCGGSNAGCGGGGCGG